MTAPRRDYDLVYLSLGAGVQSSALYVLACQGKIDPTPTVAIFADTQAEPRYVYEYLDTLERWGGDKIPIYRVTAGNLEYDATTTRNTIPLFVGSSGKLWRQCTLDYKIKPIRACVKGLLPPKGRALCYIGISMDEVVRMKPSTVGYIDHAWPLVDKRLYRGDCARIVTLAELPEPKRSACVFCPYHSNAEWRLLRDNEPLEWQRAVAFDSKIRNGSDRGIQEPAFLHRSLLPLSEAPIDDIDTKQTAFAFTNECTGMCGV